MLRDVNPENRFALNLGNTGDYRLLPGLEGAEVGGNGLGQGAARHPATMRPHELPEHRVILVSASIVADRGVKGLRDLVEVANQFFQRHHLQFRGVGIVALSGNGSVGSNGAKARWNRPVTG